MKTYNNRFSIGELTGAICKTQDTAVGPDDVHCQMLKHLPANAQNPEKKQSLVQLLSNSKRYRSWCWCATT